MKKIIASAGLVAIGAAGLQAGYAPGSTPSETSKPWRIEATLRGFYDDNYNTLPSSEKDDSFGFEVSPAVGLNLQMDQTLIHLDYVYSMKYFEGRPDDETDHTHRFDALLDHRFSERYRMQLADSFAIGQEPELLRSGNSFSTFDHIPGNNLRNTATADFTAELTRLLALDLGYRNTLYDYEEDAGDVEPPFSRDSQSQRLDRMEHLATVELKWHALPQTDAILGYKFGLNDFASDELSVAGDPADARNSRSHYFYLGASQTFRPDLRGSVRLGGQYVDFYNPPSEDTLLSPYADASLEYTYTTHSSVRLGVTHARNATDVNVLDQESTSVYAELNHAITPNLMGSILGRYQHSANNDFSGSVSGLDDTTDDFYLVGLNLEYFFNQFFSAHAGYNYDRLISDISGRSFSRNRVYMGVTARY